MQVNFNNSTIKNQTFNEYNGCEIHNQLSARDWEELEHLISISNTDMEENEENLRVLCELDGIVKKKDEKGLCGFIRKNKDNFFTNILSDTVSAGLVALLRTLIA